MTFKKHLKFFLIIFLFFSFFKGYTQLPDYIVIEGNVAPNTILSGVTNVYTYCRVKNIGSTYYNATDVLVLFTGVKQDTNSISSAGFGMKYIDEILLPGFSTNTIIFENTINLPAGDYYMVFEVQMRNDNEELNDTNNIACIPITILTNITVENNEYGTVTGLNTSGYSKDEIVQLHAEPNEGCEFLNWTEGGTEISTSQDIEFAAVSNRALTANFKRKNFLVEVTSNPIAGGQNNSSTTYPYGTVVTIEAIPKSGYSLVNWTRNDTVVSEDIVYSFTVVDSVNLVANFKKSYTISLSGPGGTTSGSGVYFEGDTVTITAVPDAGYKFTYWRDAAWTIHSWEAVYSFTATQDLNLIARFRNSFQIIIEKNDVSRGSIKMGTEYISEGYFPYNSVLTLTAEPNLGYMFQKWTDAYEDTVVSTENPYDLTVDGDKYLIAHFVVQTYEITLETTTGGSVSGGGIYENDTYHTMVATPDVGYDFINWAKADGTVASTNRYYSFYVYYDRTLTANFALKTYTIAFEPTIGGTASGDGTYDHGTSNTVTATPSTGYDFVNWTEGGTEASTSTSYTFTVNAERTLKANFSPKPYTITLESTTGGTVYGSGTYDYGTSRTVIATPNTGYDFINWTEGGVEVSTNASYTFTISTDRTLRANYAIKTYTVTLETTTGGTASGGGIFDHGTSNTVTATPASDYNFISWTQDGIVVSTIASYTFTVNSDRTLKANFDLKTYAVTFESTIGGTETGNDTYYLGTSVTITATPGEGYDFVNWTEGVVEVSTNTSYTFTVNADRTLRANYAIKTYTITLETTTGGTVSGDGTYDHGTSHTVVATPASDYNFINWTQDGIEVSTIASYTFTVDANRTLRANFAIKTYTIALESTLGGTVSGDGTYDHGTSITVTATPSTGYDFVNWTEDGTEVSTSTSYTFTVDAERTLKANFSPKPYTITLESTTGGTVSGGGTYDYGTSHTMVASPDEGYDFINWAEGGIEVSTNASYTFTISTDRTLRANYAIKTYTIALESTTGGTVSGNGTYDHGTSHTVTATPDDVHDFINWAEDGVEVSTNTSYTFTVNANRTLRANYAIKTYTVTLETTTGGTVSGGGTYDYGTSNTVTAAPDEGYNFINWTEDRVEVSTSTSYTFTVNANLTLKANYAIKTYTITLETTTGGTVSGGGAFDHGTSNTITATPNDGYDFVNWAEDGVEITKDKTFTFQVTKSQTFMANFELFTSISDIESNEYGKVYPNPVRDYVYVEIEKLITAIDDVHAVLYDISGKVYAITKISIGGNVIKFKVPKVNEGIYYINLTINSDKPIIKKIVVVKD